MATFSRLQKIALLSLGAVGGSLAYYSIGKSEKKYDVKNSWTTNYTPSVKWNKNWDHREPASLVKPKSGKPEDENRYNEQLEKAKSKAVRHLILIRHGQYHLDGATDKQRILTDLGRQQAEFTGQRLASLDIKWDLIVRSTMSRAQETANIIAQHLPKEIEVKDCQLIEEGAPVPPEPPVGHWRPEPKFFQDSARIEAAFRRYFYRAPPEQKQDSYTLLVCHANVIRFFVCKALQFPPEGWLRISLNHGSITWVSILPSGNVVLRSLSETGHMEPKYITSRNRPPITDLVKGTLESC
ncbi:serine/threonine-protein phosphatase Pgam5, mitochondrial-like isoform X2 [Pararge aegeria]|uniref:serine/threonine-protein phosphatase Pgam5, mitochondrial-like isoform X2 n=1 Tax=Pararge aegeria TaxID=116150 RepID=UPI0019D2590C|nr:serine/threonine-protein phosphatase Pgam5, mitochondrial-like isoform X2 [Pararge aegeria]